MESFVLLKEFLWQYVANFCGRFLDGWLLCKKIFCVAIKFEDNVGFIASFSRKFVVELARLVEKCLSMLYSLNTVILFVI